jgi:GTPase SAR1 family protein
VTAAIGNDAMSVYNARAAVSTRPAPDAITKFDADLVFELASKGVEERLKLAVWDFGGQSNFYSLHLLFLSRAGVYLLPLDMRNFTLSADPDRKRDALVFVRFWLSSVYSYTAVLGGRPAPVFFVGTHKDTVATPKEHEEISRFLYEQLSVSPSWACVQPFLQGEVSTGRGKMWFFPVDNTRGKEDKVVQTLMAAIEEVIEKEDYVKQKVRCMRVGKWR